MSLQIRVSRDTLTPDLRAKAAKVRNTTPVLQAMGTEIVSLAKQSFRDSALRVLSWKPKIDGNAATLKGRNQVLFRSIRITAVNNRTVTVGSDRKYAAIHQVGGVIKAKKGMLVFTVGGKKVFAKKVTIPARPYLPFTQDGQLAPSTSVQRVRTIAEKGLNKSLGIT